MYYAGNFKRTRDVLGRAASFGTLIGSKCNFHTSGNENEDCVAVGTEEITLHTHCARDGAFTVTLSINFRIKSEL